MTKTEYRSITCECGNTIKIKLTKKNLGTIVDVICAVCGSKYALRLLNDKQCEELVKGLCLQASEIVKGSDEIHSILDMLREAGIGVTLAFATETMPIPIRKLPDPLVVNGVIKEGAFTEEDDKYLKKIFGSSA